MGVASLLGGLTTLCFAVEPRGKVLEQLSPSLSSTGSPRP